MRAPTWMLLLVPVTTMASSCPDDCHRAGEMITKKYEDCGQTVEEPPPGDDECTEQEGKQAICLAECVRDAPCEVLVDPGNATTEQLQAYSDCVYACSE